jgi:hypothetical protein
MYYICINGNSNIAAITTIAVVVPDGILMLLDQQFVSLVRQHLCDGLWTKYQISLF